MQWLKLKVERLVGCQRIGCHILFKICWILNKYLQNILALKWFPQETSKNEPVFVHYLFCSQQQSTYKQVIMTSEVGMWRFSIACEGKKVQTTCYVCCSWTGYFNSFKNSASQCIIVDEFCWLVSYCDWFMVRCFDVLY